MMDTETLAGIIAAAVHEATAPLMARIAALETAPPLTIPAVHGINGKDGAPGLNGKDGLTVHGKDGKDGMNGKDGTHGRDGAKGEPGLAISDAMIDREGHLVLTWADGESKRLGRVTGLDGMNGKDGLSVKGEQGDPGLDGKDGINPPPGLPGLDGKDGKKGLDGKDGKDGLGFDDCDLVFDEAKGFQLKFTKGDRVKVFDLPVPHHLGLWEPGRTYHKGAMVTVRGGSFVALRKTTERPDEDAAGSRDWKLAAKRGRDGKPGKDGKDGE